MMLFLNGTPCSLEQQVYFQQGIFRATPAVIGISYQYKVTLPSVGFYFGTPIRWLPLHLA